MKLNFLRKKYPKFIYEKYSYKISGRNLEVFFDFSIEPAIKFQPKIIIENVSPELVERVGDRELNNLMFHLGLMEIPSYWKTTCSPEIEIRAGSLNTEQIKYPSGAKGGEERKFIDWWKDLIMNGMGQFFYENKIDWRKPNFLTIKTIPKRILTNQAIASFVKFKRGLNRNKYLVPVGGGRDSIATLELLRKEKKQINCFLVNPTPAAKEVVKAAGIKNPIIVKRIIDPTLLKLNQMGYLNGHTPFTAVLSFLAVFCAVLFDYKNIAFSLEKSANEGNVKYLGKMINHQWSKSSEFERKFKNYCKKYLAKDINYFTLLRPYTELEISQMFLKYPKYFSVFSSCNVGVKMDSTSSPQAGQRWCGNCPKCLFVYATFYPFLEKKELLKIFGRDIFQNKKLLPTMKGLLGQGRVKPFECVGTKKESRLAFSLCLKKANKSGEVPYLLRKL